MAVKQYDFKEVIVITGTFQISGFFEGSTIDIEYNDDAFTIQVGADGEGTRSKSNNLSGKATLTLNQTSSSNAILMAYALADRATLSGIFPFNCKDNSPGGASFHTAQTMWVKKVPNAPYGVNSQSRVWVLETDTLLSFLGGN